jgi:hypothetical protein
MHRDGVLLASGVRRRGAAEQPSNPELIGSCRSAGWTTAPTTPGGNRESGHRPSGFDYCALDPDDGTGEILSVQR